MATIFDTSLTDDVTHDESPGLQTSGVPNPDTGEDNNDDDILLSSISGLLTTFAGLGAPATAIGAARNQVLTFVEGASPTLKFRLFDGADSDGADPLLDSELSTLTTTAGDDPITLVRINDTTIFGYANYGDAGERVAFALYLETIAPTATEPGGANITIVQYEAIHEFNLASFDEAVDLSGLVYVDAVQDIAFDDFSTAAAGQNLWNSVTDTATGVQLLFTGFQLGSDTVNTSDFGIGSNNQSIAIGDGVVVDFVTGQTPARDTNPKTLSTINFTQRVEGPSGGFTLVQTGGNAANRVGAEVFAYDSSELGAAYHDGVIGGATQTIVAIEVWLGDSLVSAWNRTDGITNNTDPSITYGISVSNNDGVVIQGLLVHYRVEFNVGMVDGDDTGKLDRFSVQNVSAGGAANDTFDLGDIRLGGQEGDTAEVGSHINFEDDGPDAVANLAADTLVLDETRPVGTETDGDSDPAGLATVSANFADNFATPPDYGTDGAGSVSYALQLTGSNVASGLYAVDPTDTSAGDGDPVGRGDQIVLNKVGNAIVGSIGATTYFTISVDNTPASATFGYVTFTQILNVWHANTGSDDDTSTLTLSAANLLRLEQTVTDAEGDSDTAAINLGTGVFQIEDDGPDAVVSNATPDTLVLDETRPVGTETDGDSDPAGLATVSANFADNFATPPDYGTDGAGSVSYALQLTGSNVASGLYAVDPTDTSAGDGDPVGRGDQIVLNKVGNAIVGSIGATTYFTISVDNTPASATFGYVTFTQILNVWHANTGSDDDTSTLTLAAANLLRLEQTVTDAEGDSDTAAINLGTGVFQIEDDGPDAVVSNATPDTLVLDETRPVGTETDGDSDPAGLATVSANFADNFATPADHGTDGAGSVSYALQLTGSNVASGLYAVDPTDTSAGDGDPVGRGDQIVLNKVGNAIVGSIGATTYFTISVDNTPASATFGYVTFTQILNVWHANTGSDDDTSTLTLAAANLLRLEQTVTDAEGDSDTAAINLGTGVFQIEDDGPDAVANLAADTLVLDETRPVGTETDGDSDPAGLATVSANFADNFATPPDYGTDGAGSVSYALQLTGSNVASGLYAVDPTDTSAGDGDPVGRGDQIVLNKVGNAIVGSIGATTYFTISVDNTPASATFGYVTFTQILNVWHANTGSDDDTSTLTLSAANLLRLEQTVTDAEGDSDTAAINLGTGVFQIEDDGPDAVVSNATPDTLVLDESRPLGTDPGGDSDPAGLATVSANFADNFATPADHGTDGAGSVSYALQLTGSNVASGLYAVDPTDTSAGDGDPVGRGDQIVLNKVGNAIVGSIGATTYFTISVDNTPASATFGYVTFTQILNVWHANTGSDDDTSTLTLAAANLLRLEQTVTDAEGDSDTAAINLGTGVFQIEDAGPLALQPVNTSVENAVGEFSTAALDDGSPTPFSANFGSDGAGGLRFTGLNDDAGWADGDSLKDASGNLLTSNAQQIKLTGFGTSVLTAYVGADPDAVGAKVFTMTLNGDGTYTITMFAKIDDGSFDFDNFATAGAGNFTWVGVAGDEFPNKDLLVTGGNPGVDKVNNDSDDLAVGDQWIDAAETTPQGVFIPAEIIRIDFVNLGIATNTGGKLLATIDDILNPVIHYTVNNVGFTVMQTQAGNPVDVRITAIDAGDIGGADIASDLTTGTIEEILSVKIVTNSLTDPEGTTYLKSAATEEDVGGVTRLVTRDADTNALLILWDDDVDAGSAFDGSVIVYNLEGANSNQPLLRDRVFVGTDNTGFDRLEISNAEVVNSGDSFAIGDVEVGAVGENVALEFNAQIVDAEGDADSIGLIGVTVTPEVIV